MKINTEISYFEKVADLYKALEVPFNQETEFSIDSLIDIHKHKPIPYKSPVFRTNFYSFVFIKSGRGNYTTDDQTFDYNSGTIYFTNPGHIKAFKFYELSEAYLMTFSEAFLKTYTHQNIFYEFPFLLSETVTPQKPNKIEFKDIETLYLQIHSEYNRDSSFKNKIIGSLLIALLLKIKALFWDNYYPLEEGTNQSKIVRIFKENLEKHYRRISTDNELELLNTQNFAEKQQLNASYFSQVIKSKTGKSPSQWIAERTVSVSKSLLKNSSKSIKEISYAIGFSETAHFSNFFKKNTGLSPSSYRNS